MCHTQNRELNWKQSLPIPGVDSGFPGGGRGCQPQRGMPTYYLVNNSCIKINQQECIPVGSLLGGGVGILSRGVSAQVGVCLGRCLPGGGLSAKGVSDQLTRWGVCLGVSAMGRLTRGCLPGGICQGECLPGCAYPGGCLPKGVGVSS